MKMINECTTRKVDNVGRISIPKHLRNKFNMIEGCELDVYTCTDENGKQYICLTLAEKKPE